MAFWRTYYHVIWGTKRRRHVITPELEARLYAYLVRKSAELGLYVYAINGWTDHLHMVLTIPPKYALADIVGKLKGSSSHYINDRELVDFEFRWQRGYGGLTLGYTQLDMAIRYVDKQKQHHAKRKTNKWLEHVDDMNDGSLDAPNVYNQSVNLAIREPQTVYQLKTEWQFP